MTRFPEVRSKGHCSQVVNGAICAVLEVLERPGGNPSTVDVMRLYRRMMRYVPVLKARHGKRDLYGTRVYGELVALGWESAAELRL